MTPELISLLTVYGPLGISLGLVTWAFWKFAKYTKSLIENHNAITREFNQTILDYHSSQASRDAIITSHTKAVDNNTTVLRDLQSLINTKF